MGMVIGVDIGGSHITAAVVDTATGQLIPETRKRAEVKDQGDAGEVLQNWSAIISEAAQTLGAEFHIGIAMPGPFDYQQGICLIEEQDKLRSLYGCNVKRELSQRLGIAENKIRFVNDAVAFLQGEVLYGGARHQQKAMGLTLGTGLGSAMFEKGEVKDAELWRMPFRQGIAEDYLNTGWFVKSYHSETGIVFRGVQELIEDGCEEAVEKVFSRFSEQLSELILLQVRKRGECAVVIGGNIAKGSGYFLPAVNSAVRGLFPGVTIDISELGESASLMGAAGSWAMEEAVERERSADPVEGY